MCCFTKGYFWYGCILTDMLMPGAGIMTGMDTIWKMGTMMLGNWQEEADEPV